MMYVALTRAQNICHVYAGDIKGFDDSPLARIIGAPPAKSPLEMLAEKSGGGIDLTMIDPAADAGVKIPAAVVEPGGELSAKSFHGSIAQARMIASFSALITDSERDETDADAVEIDGPDEADGATFGALARFDRGVRTGLFWHELLQHLDFQKPAGIEPLVLEKLASHGFGTMQAEVVSAQVRNILAVPLEPELRLDRVARADRLPEVEFSFPIASLEPGKMRAAFARHGRGADYTDELGRLNFRPVEGFMRGFIDLLFRFDGRFYIVDWKSNWMGNRPADYSPRNLSTSILRDFYFLQYHLYTVAADLFLSRRIPGYDYEKHFGGVFYIYLRGVDATRPEQGIFKDRPDAPLIRDLRETLTGGRQ
jgi:exodeoxyribonuclease V beta subunit